MKKYLFLLPVLITTQSYAMDAQNDFFRGVLYEEPETVQELLKNPSVDVNKPSTAMDSGIKPGTPALHIAAIYDRGNIPMINLLLAAGANINGVDSAGQTALFNAATPAVAVELLKAGIDTSVKDKAGQTATESQSNVIRGLNQSQLYKFTSKTQLVKDAIERYIHNKKPSLY